MTRTLITLLCFVSSLDALGQAYPVRPIRILVPFTAGGAPDFVPRLVSDMASQALGQPIVVENRAGAGGMIASEAVAGAPPDGYTLLHNTSGHTMPPFLVKNVRFDPIKDFTPISIDVEATLYLITNPATGFRTAGDLVDYAKKFPGKLAYGSSGTGSLYHLMGELVKLSAGIDMVHVPYKGSPQSVTDLIANQIQVAFGGANILGQVRSGKIRILALLHDKRINPEIPAITETLPGYRRLPAWFGLLGPAGMPPAVVKRLEGEFIKATLSPTLKPKWEEGGFVIHATTSEQMAAQMRSDVELI